MKSLIAKIAATWRSWSLRRRLLTVGAAILVLAGAGIAAYLIVKRPEDVSNPDAVFREEPRKRQVVKTVDWPVYGYDDQRTRYLPTREVRPPFGAAEWSFNAGTLLEFSPIVVDGVLYVIDKDARVIAIDAKTGKRKWRNAVGNLSASSPAYADGTIFVVTLDPGSIVALRARDGKIRWQRDLPGRVESSPLVHGKNVIFGTEPGTVYALNRKTGKVAWQTDTAGAVKASLALDDGKLYGANYAGEVFALNAANGSFIWRSSTQGLSFDRGGPVYSTPAVAFGRVYLGSIDSRVYSFAQDTGEIAWSHSTGDWAYAAPAVAVTRRSKPTVYIGSKDKNFYALDARTGEVRWQKNIGGIILGAASVIGEVVYVAGLGEKVGTLGFDVKTGRKVFEHEFGEYNPVISDGKRLYLTGASGIRAFEHEPRSETKKRKKRRAAEKRAKERRQRAARAAKKERQRKAHAAKKARQRKAHAAKQDRRRAAHAKKLERRRALRENRRSGSRSGR